MRIIFISTDLAVFDEGSAVRKRIEAYARLFDECHFIVYTPSGFRAAALPNNLFLYPTNSAFFFLKPLNAVRIAAKIIREREIDAVSAQDPAETGLVGWLLKKTLGVRLHIQIHADFFSPFFRKNSWKELIRYWLAWFIVPRGDKFRVVSQRVANSLNSAFSIQHSAFSVLPIFVDRKRITDAVPSFDLREKYPQFDFVMLMVSRLVREKNIGLALESFREFIKEFPQAGLVIVGDGPELKNLEFRIQNLELSNHVRFEGWQNDLVPYYKGADLYLLTSNFEGYGRSVIEAVAAGCPVVMTDVGVAGEIIQDGQTGRIIPVGNTSALAKVLIESRKDYSKTQAMAKLLQGRVKSMPPQTWEEYLVMYKESFIGNEKQ